MSIRLKDYFNKNETVDFTTVSFFDDVVLALLEENKTEETIIVTMQSEDYTDNKKNIENKVDSFSWEGISFSSTENLNYNINLNKAS